MFLSREHNLQRMEKTMKKTLSKFPAALLALALAFSLFAALITPKAGAAQYAGGNIGPRANSAADPANGIYVSPTGNDSAATGSINAPYKSINAALAAAEPGGTVILRSGTYREGANVRVRKPNITIKSAKGEWAIIDLTTYNSGNNEDSGVYFDVDSSGGKLQNVEVKGGFYAVCTETKWDWGDPADRAGASNIIIEDCILHDSRYDVIKIKPNCDNVTIRYNEIYNSGQAFAGRPQNGEDNAEGIDNVNGDNMTVNNNYIHDICSNAIYAKGGAIDAVIENNRIERAYGGGILIGFDTSPEFFDLAVNSGYYENISGVVRNNLIINTGWEGIGLYGSKDARIYNNTLVNVVNSGQYHSAIYFGVTFQDWESYAGRPASVNPNIYNNIISQPADNVRPMIEIRYANELGGLSALDGNPVMSNNCYYIAGKTAAFSDYRPRSTLENAGLPAWQFHISGDSGSLETDPALDSDYMPKNPRCAKMGITMPLSLTGSNAGQPASPPSGVPSMSNFTKSKAYSPGLFTDINENEWYGQNREGVIALAYEYDLMQGSGAAAFKPAENMTIAQAITVAARVHSIYSGGNGGFIQGNVWYQVYVDYAIANGIIAAADFTDYNRMATRAQMAYIFSHALPSVEYTAQNTVNTLPDVNSGTPHYSGILTLYRAGVVGGDSGTGAFRPNDNVSRAEAAAIITRIILPSTRINGRIYG